MLKHLSERYNLEDYDTTDRNSIYIPELQMSWGEAWSALKKSWKLLSKLLLRVMGTKPSYSVIGFPKSRRLWAYLTQKFGR
jgi:hypothetical protein